MPFPNKEPEIFQAEMIEKNEDGESKTLIAKSGKRFFSMSDDLATLKLDSGNAFLIDFARRIYFQDDSKAAGSEDADDFLRGQLLNQKIPAKFENLGPENGLTKYRAAFDSSESIIYMDENLKMPVKQEFYSIQGGQKELLFTTMLENIKLETDESFFAVPKDFRKVSSEEFFKGR